MATDLLDEKIDYPENDSQQQLRAENIFGMFKTVNVIPTLTPKNWFNQIVIYKSGATIRLYIYDSTNFVWKYTALT